MKKVISGALYFLPALAFAAEPLNNINLIVQSIGQIVTRMIPIVFALILLYFFWGLAKYVLNSSDEEARKAGRGMMIWGIVALFVAASVWGLTEFIANALGINEVSGVVVPGVGQSYI